MSLAIIDGKCHIALRRVMVEESNQARILTVDLGDREAVMKTLMELVGLLRTSLDSHRAIGQSLELGDVETAKITAMLGHNALQTRISELFGQPIPPEAMMALKKAVMEARMNLAEDDHAKHKTDPRYNN